MAKVTHLSEEIPLRKLIEDFRKAGWKVHRPEGLKGTPGGPLAYFCHIEERCLVVVSFVQEAFSTLQEFAHKEDIPFNGVCSVTGELIERAAKEHPSISEDTRKMLAIAGGLYILGTKAYQTVKSLPNVQFLVLRYWDVSQNLPLLRPNPLLNAGPLSPEEVETFANQVLAHDRRVHPERFARAAVIPFKLEKV